MGRLYQREKLFEERTPDSTLGVFKRILPALPEADYSGLGQKMARAEDITQRYNPINFVTDRLIPDNKYEKAFQAGKVETAAISGSALRWLGSEIGSEKVKQFAEGYRQEQLKELETRGLKPTGQEGTLEQVARATPNTLATLATSIIVGLITKSPTVARITGGLSTAMLEGGSAYQEALDRGANENQAKVAARITGSINGAIETVTPWNILNTTIGKVLPKSVLGNAKKELSRKIVNFVIKSGRTSISEGTQEYVQEVVSNLSAKYTYDPNQSWNENAKQSGEVGALMGLIFSLAPGVGGKQLHVQTEEIKPPEITEEKQPQETFKKVVQTLPENVTTQLIQALSKPIIAENVQQLTPEEKQVMGIALNTAKELPGADIKIIENNIQTIESTGVKVPVTEVKKLEVKPTEQKPIKPIEKTPVEKPVLLAEKPVTKKEVEKVIEEKTKLLQEREISKELQEAAKKYKSAEEFVKEFQRISEKGRVRAFEDPYLKAPKITPTEEASRQEIFKYTSQPEIITKYEKGATDTEILTDFYNQAVKRVKVPTKGITPKPLQEGGKKKEVKAKPVKEVAIQKPPMARIEVSKNPQGKYQVYWKGTGNYADIDGQKITENFETVQEARNTFKALWTKSKQAKEVRPKQLKYPKHEEIKGEIIKRGAKQGWFQRDFLERAFTEGKKLSKGDFEREGIIFPKRQIQKLLKLSPEFKANPVLTMKDGLLRFEGKAQRFGIKPEAMGFEKDSIKEGTRIEVSEKELKRKEGGEIPVLESISNKKIDKMLSEFESYKLVKQTIAETNPYIRAALQVQIFRKIASKMGSDYETFGKYIKEDNLIELSRSQNEKRFIKVLRHEIRHHAFMMLPGNERQMIIDWYKGLSEEELLEIYGSKEQLEYYRDRYKNNDMLMADETANQEMDIKREITPETNKIFQLYRNIIEKIALIFSRIFKKTAQIARQKRIRNIYEKVFSQIGGKKFEISKGRIQELIAKGVKLEEVSFGEIKKAEEGIANISKQEKGEIIKRALVTEKGTLQASEVFKSAWRKLYKEEAPVKLVDLLVRPLDKEVVEKGYEVSFKEGKRIERKKLPEVRQKMREQNAQKVKELRIELRKMYKDKTAKVTEIKAKAVEYIKANLPQKRRGDYLTAVKNAKTAKNLDKILVSVDKKRANYERSLLITSVNKIAGNIQHLPVDIQRTVINITSNLELKKHTQRLLNRLQKTKEYLDKKGTDMEMPRRVLNELGILERRPLGEISTDELIDINNKLGQYYVVGRNIIQDKIVREKRTLTEAIDNVTKNVKNLDFTPIEEKINTFEKDKLSTPEKESLTFKEMLKNLFTMDKDKRRRLQLNLIGIDRLLNKIDGRKDYTGENYKTFKVPIDDRWNVWQENEDKIKMSFYQTLNELKLTEKNSKRIAIYAYNQQRGGRQKLLEDRKLTEQQIDSVILDKKEMAIYQWMRKQLDDLHDKLSEKLETENNEMIGKPDNYFPMFTDYGVTKPLLEEFVGENRLTRVPFGSIKERQERAKQALKLDAFQVFDSYVGKATYFVAMDSTIAKLGKIASSDNYRKAVGDNAQRAVLTWLDVLARKGGAIAKESKWDERLNDFNNNLSIVILGLRITTIAKQPLALLDGASDIGAYAFKGAREVVDEEWRNFMWSNSSEMRNRAGGDPAFEEISHNKFVPKIQDKAMQPIKFLDRYTAGAVWIGAYMKKMDELGFEIDFKIPNQEAVRYANLSVRKTQAGGTFKDLPLIMTAENRKYGKMIFKFQNFVLNRWSYLSEDLPDKFSKDKSLAVKQVAFISLSTLLEGAISNIYYNMFSGGDDDKEDKKVIAIKSFISSAVQTIPGFGQVFSALNYGTNPVPLISTIDKFFNSLAAVIKGKKPETKIKHAIRVLSLAVGVRFGMPTEQARALLEKWLFDNEVKSRL